MTNSSINKNTVQHSIQRTNLLQDYKFKLQSAQIIQHPQILTPLKLRLHKLYIQSENNKNIEIKLFLTNDIIEACLSHYAEFKNIHAYKKDLIAKILLDKQWHGNLDISLKDSIIEFKELYQHERKLDTGISTNFKANNPHLLAIQTIGTIFQLNPLETKILAIIMANDNDEWIHKYFKEHEYKLYISMLTKLTKFQYKDDNYSDNNIYATTSEELCQIVNNNPKLNYFYCIVSAEFLNKEAEWNFGEYIVQNIFNLLTNKLTNPK